MQEWVTKDTYVKIISKESNKLHLENSFFSSFKQKIRTYKTSDNLLKKAFYFIILFLWRLFSIPYRFLFNLECRSLIFLKYAKGHEVHQVSNYTEYNRYPDLFSKCKELMHDRKELKILSYGCSTGEEVFTLREYFPDAFIIGVDINKRNIKKAISQNNDDKIIFSADIENTLAENGPFEIIFALAVFQRTENRNKKTFDSSTTYPFEKFNTKIMELDRNLKPNGLFVIDHADYFFENTEIVSCYHSLKGNHNIVRDRYMFDKNNQKLENYIMHHRIFIKK